MSERAESVSLVCSYCLRLPGVSMLCARLMCIVYNVDSLRGSQEGQLCLCNLLAYNIIILNETPSSVNSFCVTQYDRFTFSLGSLASPRGRVF